jgi:hypothetical protein
MVHWIIYRKRRRRTASISSTERRLNRLPLILLARSPVLVGGHVEADKVCKHHAVNTSSGFVKQSPAVPAKHVLSAIAQATDDVPRRLLLGHQSDRLPSVDKGHLVVPFFDGLCQLLSRLDVGGERFWVGTPFLSETIAECPARELLRPGQTLGEIEYTCERSPSFFGPKKALTRCLQGLAFQCREQLVA